MLNKAFFASRSHQVTLLHDINGTNDKMVSYWNRIAHKFFKQRDWVRVDFAQQNRRNSKLQG